MNEFLDGLPDLTAQQAAFIACFAFVLPPLAMCWWDEHVAPRLPWRRR